MKGNRVAVIVGVLVVVVAVGFVALRGHWPPKSGTEGAIGAANRYTAQQISDQDVTLKDPQVQAFLQSDTFHQLATNPEFKQCAADQAFKGALENKAFVEMLKTGDLGVLKTEAMRSAVDAGIFRDKTPDQLQVLFGADLIRLLDNRQFVEMLKTDALRTEALHGKLDAAKNKVEWGKFVNTDAWRTLEANKLFVEMLKTGDLNKVADNGKFVGLLTSDQFSKVPTADLAMILSDQAVQSMLVNDSFMKLADEARFTDALKVDAFSQIVKAGDLSRALAGEQ